jgi:hypothetical protein
MNVVARNNISNKLKNPTSAIGYYFFQTILQRSKTEQYGRKN